MADLRISELTALAGANLASGDLLAIVDVSASETKKITVVDLVGNATTLIADATIPGAKIVFSANTIAGSALTDTSVEAAKLASGAVTAGKLADESTVDLVTTLPLSGAFIGQLALDTDDNKMYCWNGSTWVSFKAGGSVNTVIGGSSGIVNITTSVSGDEVTISTTLDNTSGAAQFLAGPTSAAGAVTYRQIASGDMPTAGAGGKGAVQISGNGLAMSGDILTIDNTITANTSAYHVVQYSSKGLVTAGREITAEDLPVALSGTVGAVYPGTGLLVDGAGELSHANSVTSGTGTKVSFDSEGHITSTDVLLAADIPNLDAAKITTGTFNADLYAASTITGEKLANYAVTKLGETQPTADHIGQFFFNPLTRDLFLWDGNVYQPVGISVGEIIFGGTYDASTNLVDSVTADGTAAGFVVGNALTAASTVNNKYYFVVSEAGTGVSPAPVVALDPPDILLSNGISWVKVDVSDTVIAQLASNVQFTPAGSIASTNVQSAIQELDTEKLALAGGTLTGNLVMGTATTITFEGATANDFETTLTVTDPTADRTVTFQDATGTVALTSDLDDGAY